MVVALLSGRGPLYEWGRTVPFCFRWAITGSSSGSSARPGCSPPAHQSCGAMGKPTAQDQPSMATSGVATPSVDPALVHFEKNVLKKAGKRFGEHTSLLRMKYVRTCPETWLEPSLGANLSCTYLAPGLNLSYTLLTPDMDITGARLGRHLSRICNPTGSTGGGVTEGLPPRRHDPDDTASTSHPLAGCHV